MRSSRLQTLVTRISRAVGAHSSATYHARPHEIAAQPRALRVRGFATAPTYPSAAETTIMASDDDRHDHNASHLVCSNCSSSISNTKDLVFFKWRGGIHMSSMTEAPLQRLRADKHWDSDENPWKKCKLYCIKCNHSIGMIARVFNSDKILFKASDVAIHMPVHQSPMISLSGYPSSMLGFSMWSELLLMLESQPNLKQLLDIRRLDNISRFRVGGKEINTMFLLASDLKSLLDLVENHTSEMNHVNMVTAILRAALLVAAQNKATQQAPFKFRLSVTSEAPEDLLLDFPAHVLADPRIERASQEELNKRLWKLVDVAEGFMNFGIDAFNSVHELSVLASGLWRLNIGRPSILKPMALQTIKLAQGLGATFDFRVTHVASAIAHLASKDIRGEEWVRDVLFTAAEMCIESDVLFKDPEVLAQQHHKFVSLARSMSLTGHFHEEYHRQFFAMLAKEKTVHAKSRLKVYQSHLENLLMQRGGDFVITDEKRLKVYKTAFASSERQAKNGLFRVRHQVASTLEAMNLQPTTLHSFPELGYTVDLALVRQRIAIELNDEAAYLAHDPRSVEDEHDAVAMESGFRQRLYTPLPSVDLKARHLEHTGWIVVQLPIDEFSSIRDSDKRAEYVSMLIVIATYTRAQQLEDEQMDHALEEEKKKQ